MYVRQQPPPKRVQTPTEKLLPFLHRALVVQAVAVELGDPRRRHHDPFREAVVQYVEREQERSAEGGGEAVIGGRLEGQEVQERGGLGAVVVETKFSKRFFVFFAWWGWSWGRHWKSISLPMTDLGNHGVG